MAQDPYDPGQRAVGGGLIGAGAGAAIGGAAGGGRARSSGRHPVARLVRFAIIVSYLSYEKSGGVKCLISHVGTVGAAQILVLNAASYHYMPLRCRSGMGLDVRVNCRNARTAREAHSRNN